MQIDKVTVRQINLPFLGEFSHSHRKGLSAENIVVEVSADRGKIIGYGEGAPRPYVTGESQQGAADWAGTLVEAKGFPWELNGAGQIWRLVDEHTRGKENNAAVCAVEMALLDALGKSEGRSVVDYFSRSFYTDKIWYGAPIPLSQGERVEEVCLLLKRLSMDRIKVKMGRDADQNRETMDIVARVFGKGRPLRIDVNGAWDLDLALKHIDLMIGSNVKVVEDPMRPDDADIRDFSLRMRDYGITLMADESACCLSEVNEIIGQGHHGMVNVRLSKCGGFRNSLKIIHLLREEGLGFQVGCQLGESGILSAAGRALALLCRDAAYVDGSYDRLLLAKNATQEHVGFGQGGMAGPLKGPGLGISVNTENLRHLGHRSPVITIKRP